MLKQLIDLQVAQHTVRRCTYTYTIYSTQYCCIHTLYSTQYCCIHTLYTVHSTASVYADAQWRLIQWHAQLSKKYGNNMVKIWQQYGKKYGNNMVKIWQ